MTTEAAIFTCSICGEPSAEICVYCTKDACANHRCERCKRCSDCCACEIPLSAEEFPVAREVETPREPVLTASPESLMQPLVEPAPPVSEPAAPASEAAGEPFSEAAVARPEPQREQPPSEPESQWHTEGHESAPELPPETGQSPPETGESSEASLDSPNDIQPPRNPLF
jgi:hypothetical protein